MKPINYSNTVMYKIVPKDLNSDLIYVGHTTNFRKRKSQHKENCNNLHYEKFNLILTKIAEDIDSANLRYLNSIDWEEAKKIVDSSINIESLLRKSINNNNTYLKIDYCMEAYNIFIPIIEDFRGETCDYDDIKDEQFVKEIDSLKRKRS